MGPEQNTISKADALAEAYKRGLLPPDKKAAYEEAQKRGLVKPAQPADGARNLEAERAALIAGEDQRRKSQVEAARTENYRSAPNPIIAAQRQSQVDAGNAFAESKKPYDMVGAVASDLGKFAKTSPLNAINAGVGAVEGTLNIPSDLINSARIADAKLEVTPEMAMRNANRMPMMQQRVGKAPTPIEKVPMLPRADFSAARMEIAPEDQSITGMLAEGLGQFVVARVGIGKLAPGGGMTSQLSKDVAATGAAFAGENGRVADMIDLNAVPEGTLRDYVRWLKTQPGDDPILGRIKNMSEDATLNMLLVGLGRTAKAGYNAATGKGAPLTPTNAGGAPNARVAPPQAPAAPVAQTAPQPSVAPVVPQTAPRAAQAGPAGAGQQAGAGAAQPVLNAVRVAPAATQQQALVARDTAKILTRIMRAANLKNADIRGYLPGAVQRYKSLNDSRVPFAFFLESDLPKHFAEPVAADVVTKLQGWGRARNAAMGTGDTSAQITQGTIKELRGTQQDFLTQSAEANLYKGSLISQEDQILKSLRETGKKGYEPVLAYARDAMEGKRVPNAAERAGFEELRGVLGRPVFRDRIPNDVRMTAEAEGLDILELIERDPVTAAHWLQSNLNKLEDAAEINGRATPASLAYGKMRADVLEPLKKAAPGYEGALNRYGHEWGSKNAVRFGKGLFTEARSAYDTGQKVRAFKRLGRRQQTVALKSIRDEFLNEFRGTAEDAAAKITRMQQEGALDLLEQLGARGKRFADDIRRIAQQENPSIRAIEQASNSLTFKNLTGAEAAREMVQSPINQAVGSVTDKTSWPMTIAADAVVMGTTGLPVPLMTAAKALDRFGNPGPKTLSRATEGLYGLPPTPTPGTALAPTPRAPRGAGKPKPPPAPLQQDLGTLLKALDEVEKDPKHRGGPEGKRLMDQIEAVRTGQAAAPAKPRRVKGAAPAAPTTTAKAKPPLPGQTSNASPTATGIVVGGVGGAMADQENPLRGAAIGAGVLGAAGAGVGNRLAKGSTPKPPKGPPAKPAFDQRFMKEAQRLVSYNGGVDKAIKAQQYVIDQLKNSKAPNAQDRLNRAVSVQYAIRRMAERSNRELDQIAATAPPQSATPKPPPVKNGFGGKSLPMDEPSRMQRAKAWGGGADVVTREQAPKYKFQTGKPVTVEGLHGTRGRDFDRFDLDEAGSNFSQDEGTLHFSDNADDANAYAVSDTLGLPASDGAVYPVYIRMQNPLVADREFFMREGMGDVFKNEDRIGAWDTYHPFLKERAEELGADGIILKDSFNRSHYVSFDPKNIRGKFAKFDPSQQSSSKLLAGVRGQPEAIGAGLGTVFAPDADGDGEVSFGERAGAAITGGVMGRGARAIGNRLGGAGGVKAPMRGPDQAGISRRDMTPAKAEIDKLRYVGEGDTLDTAAGRVSVQFEVSRRGGVQGADKKVFLLDGKRIGFTELTKRIDEAYSLPKPPEQAGFFSRPKQTPADNISRAIMGDTPTPTANRLAKPKPPPKGPPGTVSRMVAGGAIGGIAGGVAGEAGGQSPETAQSIADNKAQLEDVLGQIAGFESDLKIFSTGTPKEIQAQLDREGFNLGPTGIDGNIGANTAAAIRGRKAEINQNLTMARNRLKDLEAQAKELEYKAAFERTRPTDGQQQFRDFAPLLGGALGAVLGKGARLGGSAYSKVGAKKVINELDALLNTAPIVKPKTPAQIQAVKAEIDRRATNLNEFWRKGGSDKPRNLKQRVGMEPTKGVPFETKTKGEWTARASRNVMSPSDLFPDRFIGRNVGPMDALIGGAGATEAYLADQNAQRVKAQLSEAYKTAKDDQSEKNLARVQELEDQYALSKAWAMLGTGLAVGTGIGVFTSKYASKRGSVPKAEEELAILRRAIADLKKQANKPPKVPRALPTPQVPPPPVVPPIGPPTSTTIPPLPPARPRGTRKPPVP